MPSKYASRIIEVKNGTDICFDLRGLGLTDLIQDKLLPNSSASSFLYRAGKRLNKPRLSWPAPHLRLPTPVFCPDVAPPRRS